MELPKQYHQRWLCVIVMVALVLRLCVWANDPFSYEPKKDSRQYHTLAKNLVENGVLSLDDDPPITPSARRVPAYPLFLAAVYALAGPDVHAAKASQILLSISLCVLTFAVGRAAFRDNRIALLGALLVAVSPPLIGSSNHLLTEELFTSLLLAVVFAAYRWTSNQRASTAVLLGVLCGALALTKPEALLLLGLVLPACLVAASNRQRMFIQGLVVLGAMACVVAPWFYRNHIVLGEFRLILKQVDNASGELENADGMMRSWRKCAEAGLFYKPNRYKFYYDDVDEAQRRFEIAMEADVENPGVSDVMYFVRRPNKFLFCCYGRFLGLLSPSAWGGAIGLGDGFSEYKSDGRYIQLGLKAGLLIGDALLLVLGGIGLLLSLRPKHRHLWIITASVGYFLAVYVLVHGIARYRVPLTPLLLLLAVWVVCRLLSNLGLCRQDDCSSETRLT